MARASSLFAVRHAPTNQVLNIREKSKGILLVLFDFSQAIFEESHIMSPSLRQTSILSLLAVLVQTSCSSATGGETEATRVTSTTEPDWSALESAILGGTEVNGKAGLVELASFGCTGTMIGPTAILTAAHCVPAGNGLVGANIRYFRPGLPAASPEQWPGLQVLAVQHPSFAGGIDEQQDSDHDVALLLISDPIHASWPSTDYHDYVRVQQDTLLPSRDTYVDFYGRGFGSDAHAEDGVLRKGRFKREDETTFRLEMDTTETRGMCEGDSGGPMLIASANVEIIACVQSGGDIVDGSCIEEDWPFLFDDFWCARAGQENTEDFIADFSDVNCTSITNNGTYDYLRCFDLPFVSDISDNDRLPIAVATAIVASLRTI